MSNLAQKTVRFLFTKIAKRVEKNHLFEQPYERESQSPLHFEKPNIDEDVSLSSIEDIATLIHQYPGLHLVHHWATWCDGCMEEIADVQKFTSALKEMGISTTGISWELFNGTPPQHALPVVQHVHVSHSLGFASKVIRGNPDDFFEKLALKEHQIPQTALYKNGACIYSHLGILSQAEQEKIYEIIKRGEDE